MHTPHVLIVYGTKYGQTERIAIRLASLLADAGLRTTLLNSELVPPELSLHDYDGVIVGCSVIFGRFRRSIRRFVRTHRTTLAIVPTAFFSVSGTMASGDPAERAEIGKLVARFLAATGWCPSVAVDLAGAIAYTKYNPLERWALRRMAGRNGASTDVAHDLELTDWDAVARFAEDFRDRMLVGVGAA